jgi:hypothetical protein
MMKKFDLNLCYKGERQYIHGTDMLNKSVELLREQFQGEFAGFDFTIHRMSDSNLSLCLYPHDQAPELIEQDIVALKFDAAGESWEARLKETEDQPDCRYPFDEESIVRLCAINSAERSIQLQHEAQYSTIEILVAMTKALHLDVYPGLDANWMFCRWESPHWPLGVSLNGACVRLLQALGTRLTRSEVSLDGVILGHIYFCTGND